MTEPLDGAAQRLDRREVRQLLGIGDPADVRAQASFEGPVSSWRGVQLRRVTLIAADSSAIPCFFLTPPVEPPWPAGAIAVHQHNEQFHLGKSEPAGRAGNPDLAYGLALARLGVATVMPDLSGFEERRGPHESGTGFEQMQAGYLAAGGTSLQGKHVEDIAMATTWLAENGSVSGDIGIVGHSLGGQSAFFALACDPRLRAGVISCGIATLASFHGMNILHNPAWYVPGLVEAGDVPAVAAAIRDQQVRVLAGENDPIFPVWAAQEVVQAFSDAPVDLTVFDGQHEYPTDLQRETLHWLSRTLGVHSPRGHDANHQEPQQQGTDGQ